MGHLSDLKESYPLEVAVYATISGIQDELAFLWWVSHVLCRRKWIIAAVKSRYHTRTHKFEICVPKTVKETLQLIKVNGNNV